MKTIKLMICNFIYLVIIILLICVMGYFTINNIEHPSLYNFILAILSYVISIIVSVIIFINVRNQRNDDEDDEINDGAESLAKFISGNRN